MTDPTETAPLDPALLQTLGIAAPEHITTTPIATIWRVYRTDGRHAALKLYHTTSLANEAPGLELLRDWDGRAAALLYDVSQTAVLLEWLDGPSLGEDWRSGNQVAADAELGEIAKRLHANAAPQRETYPRLDDWVQGLLDLTYDQGCRQEDVVALERAKEITRHLIATQAEIHPLHGDLHHDNVRRGARGLCAFDPKGVVGEPAYELANAFRNPKGALSILCRTDLIETRADLWSAALQVDRQRMLLWASAKCALSMAWRSRGTFTNDPEIALLQRLLTLTSQPLA